MLVDGGGIPVLGKRKSKPRMDIGEDVVAPYLWSRSFRNVDILVGTHLHADHVGGLPALIENFRPKELWISAPEDNPEWLAMEEKAKAVGTRVIEMRVGGGGSYGGAEVDVLSPGADFVPGPSAENNDSLVLRVSYGRHSFLLMGDADRSVERNIALRPVDVLKVGHHGSKNSSSLEFLKAVRPSWALIPVGADNMYRLPSAETLERLAQLGVAVFRTDVDGLVSLRTDGRRFTAKTQKDAKVSQR
jgi:competence protein ComEC